MDSAVVSRALAVEPGGKTVELALFAIGENLLVPGLNLLESDGLALLQPEPVGVRFGLLVVAAGHVESLVRKSHLGAAWASWKTDRAILVWGETRSPSGKDLRMLLDTRRSRRPRVLLAVPATLVAAAALIGSPAALATPNAGAPQAAPTAATTQGIIMSDGRICNPRWGC